MENMIKKIILLNQTYLNSVDENNATIIKNFTKEGIKILSADFGFALGKLNSHDSPELIYKSSSTPFNPTIPPSKNYATTKRGNLFFDSDVIEKNYESEVCRYAKSLIVIPIQYGDRIYGKIVLCYKNKHYFTEEEFALGETIGNTLAQAITINWLAEDEHKMLNMVEKQKEIEVLLEQEKLKTDFIANATHELRTPLAIMKGNVDLALMSKGNDPKVFKGALQEVNTEIKLLAEILKDLALLTSDGKGIKQVINRVPINMEVFLRQIVRRVEHITSEKNITIALRNYENSPILFSGDDKYLEKLFLNLIKNGITYGKDGGHVYIDVSKQDNMVKIKVADDGIGITKEDLPKIFERFYRADKAHGSYGNHSGLGLAIARLAAEAHGGEIKVESVYGKGSTFTVLLPLDEKKLK